MFIINTYTVKHTLYRGLNRLQMYVREIKEKQIFKSIKVATPHFCHLDAFKYLFFCYFCHIHMKSIQTTTQCVCFTVLALIISVHLYKN